MCYIVGSCQLIHFIHSIQRRQWQAPHSSTLPWKIPWTEKPGRLQPMGSLRVGHDWVTSLSLFTFMHWRRKWQPTSVFLPGESQGRGSLVGSVYGVTQSWIWLKQLSSSSSMHSISTVYTSPNPSYPPFPPWCPYISNLYPCLFLLCK